MSKGMITSIDTATQVYIKFRKKKKVNKKHGYKYRTQHKQTYENGDKCVRIWKRREIRIHVLTHIRRKFRIIDMQIEKKDRHMSRVMRITRAPYQRYVLDSQDRKKENKRVVMNTKPSTNYAALATLVERQVKKKSGRAATRRNAPKLPRDIRAGPHRGCRAPSGQVHIKKNWGLYTGGLFNCFS